jgi:TonB family protein
MIAAWILYALLVGVLAGAGALVLEALLRAHRLSTRWIWAGAMALSLFWPLGHLLWRNWPRAAALVPLPDPSRVAVLDPLAVQVAPESFLRSLDVPILAIWAVSTAVLLVLFAFLILRTQRLRKGWRGEEAGGRSVLFSQDLGPAVVGFIRPQIVLPSWCKELEDQTLRLILEHESEHLRAGDLRLIFTAGVLPILFPWHLPIWWQFKHLRLAVEGDCDLRVLRTYPDRTRPYLELLLHFGKNASRSQALAAMLSEPEETLERRIRIMTMPFPKRPWTRGVLLTAFGGFLVAVACWAPSPTDIQEEAAELVPAIEIPPTPETIAGPVTPVMATADIDEDITIAPTTFEDNPVEDLPPPPEAMTSTDLSAAPTFTPWTAQPEIENRPEVVAALEREYPPLLRDAGIGGTTSIWFFIDDQGVVQRFFVDKSSGHQALDDAALEVARRIEFTPALNRDKRVPVWISLPITFTTR